MFKNWKIAWKLSTGFGILIVILGITAFVTWSSLESIKTETADSANVTNFNRDLLQARVSFRMYFESKDKKDLTDVDANLKTCGDLVAELQSASTDAKNSEILSNADKQLKDYIASRQEYEKLDGEKDARDESMVKSGAKPASKLKSCLKTK